MKTQSLKKFLLQHFVFSIFLIILIESFAFFLFIGNLENSIKERQYLSQKAFTNSISNEINSGAFVNVYRKCKIFSDDPEISYIHIVDLKSDLCTIDKQNKYDYILSTDVHFDASKTLVSGKIEVGYHHQIISSANRDIAASILFVLIFVTGVLFFLGYKIQKYIATPIFKVAEYLDQFPNNSGNHFQYSEKIGLNEISILIIGLQNMKEKITDHEKTIKSQASNSTFIQLASQVAHDIRSPLTALNLMISVLVTIPEEQRLIIKNATNRITDIANQLLQKSKRTNIDPLESDHLVELSDNSNEMTVELLPAIVELLVSEKRIQFRDKININIESDFEESYGAFVSINSIELKRVISNLITNSVEALKDHGRVIIAVRNYDSKIILSIRDTGSGIPKHILEKLGQRGVTYGKENTSSGSGLGIYHAKKTIESFGAEFNIYSQEGRGTEIKIVFMGAAAPLWFVDSLILDTKKTIVILDDDTAIHSVWSERLSGMGIKIINFTSSEEFKVWVISNGIESSLFLVDFELLNQHTNGLELIENLELSANAILVTSRFEDEIIRQSCIRLKLRMIPKTMAALIPIKLKV